MPDVSQKIQLRAQLISTLNKYRNQDKLDAASLKQDLEVFKNFHDKDLLAKVLFKEISSSENDYLNICAIFALESLNSETFENHSIEFLKNPNIKDEKKFYMVSLLKQKGIPFDYNDITGYIEHPEQIAQKGVKDFLYNAILDPEVQIDLLDFYTNIPYDEQMYLKQF